MNTYKVKQQVHQVLVLSNAATTPSYSKGDKIVMGKVSAIAGNTFTYESVDNYRFGCGSGRFNYASLIATIKAGEAVLAKQTDANGVVKKTGGKPINTLVVETSDNFYITDKGKAYSKNEYDLTTFKPDAKETFGGFKWYECAWSPNDCQFKYNGHDAGKSMTAIMDSLYQAQAYIDFVEDRKPTVEKKAGNKVAKSK